MRFTVKAEWMKACGKGDQDKTFDVVKVEPRYVGTKVIEFVIVNDNGYPWTVLAGRGRFV